MSNTLKYSWVLILIILIFDFCNGSSEIKISMKKTEANIDELLEVTIINNNDDTIWFCAFDDEDALTRSGQIQFKHPVLLLHYRTTLDELEKEIVWKDFHASILLPYSLEKNERFTFHISFWKSGYFQLELFWAISESDCDCDDPLKGESCLSSVIKVE